MFENLFGILSKNERRRLHSLTESLDSAHARGMISNVPTRRYGIVIAITGIYLITVWSFPLTMLIAALVTAILYLIHRARRAWNVIEAFERDYPAFLLSLASAVKTGLDPFDAMLLCGEMFSSQSPIRQQVAQVEHAVRDGQREDRAIKAFGSEISHPDIKLFHDAFIIARQCGASISPVLYRLAKFTRQRQSFRRKVSAAVAMQRLSSYGIIGCCIVIACIQCVASPQGILLACREQMGQIMLSIGMSLMVTGMLWMLYLTRRRV